MTHLVATESDYVESKTVYKATKSKDLDQLHRSIKNERSMHSKTTKT